MHMKHRFITEKKRSGSGNLIISVLFFLAVTGIFLLGTSTVTRRTDARAREHLEQALGRGIVHCYSMEGAYPESLQYLKDHYGLIYDEDRFFVDYQVLGSNLFPDVTIIDRGERP